MKPAKIIESGIHPAPADPLALCRSAILSYAGHVLAELDRAQQQALSRLEQWTPTERLLDTREAATYLKKSRRWLDEATRAGRNPLVKFTTIGGEKRFRKSWLDDYADRNAAAPKEMK